VQVHGADTFEQENTDCDGSDQSVINSLTCTISMATLTESPFGLIGGDSIWVKVVATNAYGSSE
jgi:hypothetical protein